MKFCSDCISSIDNLEMLLREVTLNISKKPVIVVPAFINVTDMLKQAAFELRHLPYDDMLRGNYKRLSYAKDVFQKIFDHHVCIANSIGVDLNGIEFTQVNDKFFDRLSDSDRNFKRFRDGIISVGERYSSRIIARFLSENNISAVAHDSYELGLVTDSNYGNAFPLDESYINIRKGFREVDKKRIHIVTGFIGKDKDGYLTTLGPDSADDVAVMLSIALHCDEILSYKTPKGVMSGHPRIISNPITIPSINYHEATELHSYGVSIMSPNSLLNAARKNIKIKIKCINDPRTFTLISKKSSKRIGLLKSITFRPNINIVRIDSPRMVGSVGYIAEILKTLADNDISVDVLSSSGTSISITLDPYIHYLKTRDEKNEMKKLEKILEKFGDVKFLHDKTIVALVGNGVMNNPSQVIYKASKVLYESDIHIIMASLSESSYNYSLVVDNDKKYIAITKLHDEFFRTPRSKKTKL